MIYGRHHLFFRRDGRALPDAHHQRNARAVDVAIEQADLRAEMPQRAREIYRASGFADAALAARHRDDSRKAGDAILSRHPALARDGSLLAGRHLHFDVNHLRLGQRADGLLTGLLELSGNLVVRRGQLDGDADRAVVRGDVLDDAEGNDVPRIAGIFHRLEGVRDGVLIQHSGVRIVERRKS